jgi:hypothetical protein
MLPSQRTQGRHLSTFGGDAAISSSSAARDLAHSMARFCHIMQLTGV